MASYRVRAIGADFDADDDGAEYPNVDAARQAALKAGIAIATDEIGEGKNYSIVEVRILDGKRTSGRFVVALAVEELRPS
jgi:hypothetical protein